MIKLYYPEMNMKRLLFLLTFIIISLNSFAQIEKGKSSIGYSAGYTTVTYSGMLNLDYRYNLTKGLRLAPSMSAIIKKYGYRGWMANTDIHYVIPFQEAFAIYPLVGGCYSWWDYKIRETKKYRAAEKYWGANFGLGAEVYVVDEIIMGLELKYNKLKKHDQVIAALRIAYYLRY